MKRALLATLALTMLSAHAAENYGGIRFHSSVPQNQLEAMKADIKYLFNTPVSKTDAEFMQATGLTQLTGPTMHNWIANRVKHVVGEGFSVDDSNVLISKRFVYPKTPIPDLTNPNPASFFGMDQESPVEGESDIKTVMSNLGSALYLTGKIGIQENKKNVQVLFGVDLDGSKVYATSTRIGLLKVGEGLFYEKFALSPNITASANSINRLGTFFHEARHSDGSGMHTGFVHAYCPETHAYGGVAACEKSTNGPYSIGGLSLRTMMNNCTDCSESEKGALATLVLDAFSRILSGANAAARLQQYASHLEKYKLLSETGKGMLATATPEEKIMIEGELIKLDGVIALLKKDMELLKKDLALVPKQLDPAPEGYFSPVTLKDSMATMAPVKK